jgi:sugar-specific transcriptional regulator TrmB
MVPETAGLLKEMGLTESEIRAYLALLETGSSKKGPLVKKTGISSSKIYEVLDRLIEKGLVSYVLKNKVRHFNAAPPSRIKDYLQEKGEKIKKQENMLEHVLPHLETIGKTKERKTDAEVYRGWKGMQTVYNDLLETLEPGEEYVIFGASRGEDEKRVRSFFKRFGMKVVRKKLKAKIIFNENARGNIPNVERTAKVRYLDHTTPSEILIYGHKTAIVLLEKEPLVILIRGENVAKSFRRYFDVMWGVAKS